MREGHYFPQPRFTSYVCYPESIGHYYDDPTHREQRVAGQLGEYNLHLLFAGEGYVEVGDRLIHLQEGMGFLYGPGMKQSYGTLPAKPWSVRWIHFHGVGIETLLGGKGLDEAWIFQLHRMDRVLELIHKLYRNASPFEFEKEPQLSVDLYELLLELMQNAEDINASSSYKLRSAVLRTADWIRTHCHETLTLQQMAHRSGYSSYYFSRIFHAQMKKTPIEFLMECRILRAKQLLTSTEWSVKQIAQAVGFTQSSYFIRCFRAAEGITPIRFREK